MRSYCTFAQKDRHNDEANLAVDGPAWEVDVAAAAAASAATPGRRLWAVVKAKLDEGRLQAAHMSAVPTTSSAAFPGPSEVDCSKSADSNPLASVMVNLWSDAAATGRGLKQRNAQAGVLPALRCLKAAPVDAEADDEEEKAPVRSEITGSGWTGWKTGRRLNSARQEGANTVTIEDNIHSPVRAGDRIRPQTSPACRVVQQPAISDKIQQLEGKGGSFKLHAGLRDHSLLPPWV